MDLDLTLESISHGDVLEFLFDVRGWRAQGFELLFLHLRAHGAECFDIGPVALGKGITLEKLYSEFSIGGSTTGTME